VGASTRPVPQRQCARYQSGRLGDPTGARAGAAVAAASTRALTASPTELHLHDLGFFVLEMIVDRFDKAIGKLLHFVFHIA